MLRTTLHSKRSPDYREPCPACGPTCRRAYNRTRPVRAVWYAASGELFWYCNRCGDSGHKGDGSQSRIRKSAPTASPEIQQAKAQACWDRSFEIAGTFAEAYLFKARGLEARPLPTLRYLPAWRDHPHAMIAAFGFLSEVEPGVLETPKNVSAIHLTRLSPDGLQKIDKRMLGPVSGHPIVLAPPNDGLGLVVAEGIEEALSFHQVTGLGAWAAGSASHLAKLGAVVPSWIDCVSVVEDDDPAGQNASARFAADLAVKGISVRMVRLRGI